VDKNSKKTMNERTHNSQEIYKKNKNSNSNNNNPGENMNVEIANEFNAKPKNKPNERNR